MIGLLDQNCMFFDCMFFVCKLIALINCLGWTYYCTKSSLWQYLTKQHYCTACFADCIGAGKDKWFKWAIW